MANGIDITPGTGKTVSTEELTSVNGGAVTNHHAQRFVPTLRTAAGTAVDIPGDAANGQDVDVTRLPAVDQGAAADLSAPWPVVITDGTNIVIPDGAGRLGVVVAAALPAGGNAIGKLAANSGVDIGDVDVTSVPADPFGTNADAIVAAGAAGSISAKLRRITQALEDLKTTITLAGTVALDAGTLAALETIQVGSLPALPAGTNRIGSFRQVDSADADLTSARGTQTSRFLGTQRTIDAGRTQVRYYATAAAAGASGTETAITLTKSSGTSATSTGTSHTPTSGKKYRITSITFATRGHATATIQSTTFSLRVNTGGAVTTTSTPIILQVRSATPATASAWDRVTITFPEGLEIDGNGTLQFGVTAAATYTTNAPTWDVLIDGYEY